MKIINYYDYLIIIIIKDKNFFVTFFNNDHKYTQYLELLEKNGLIESKYLYGKNNIFFSPINRNISIKNKSFEFVLNKYQKVYRHLYSQHIFQKNSLYKCYLYMKMLFSEEFNYMPQTFYFPEEEKLINKTFHNYSINVDDLWLVKPSSNGEGKGIFFFLKNIQFREYIITKYITKVNLIDGKKYDLRLYVLVPNLKPLRIYFYKEGIVRIASEKYSLI